MPGAKPGKNASPQKKGRERKEAPPRDVGYGLDDPYYTTGDAIAAGLPEDQREALTRYSSYGFLFTNEALREGAPLGADDAAMVAKVDKALASARLPEAVNLYRGVDTDSPVYKLAVAGRLGQGTVLTDGAYMSTTTSASTAAWFASRASGRKKGAVVKIHAKRGASGLSITSITANKGERETLLPRNARLRVRSVRRGSGDEPIQIDVDLL